MEATATGSLITINIDGKPLEKLIEVVSNGIGTLYRPRKIRKEADAQAYAIKVLENAKAVAGSETMLIEAETVERIGQRLVAQEIRRQNNIDAVVEKAAEELKGKKVSDDPVDEDWATRFFGIVQDVSKEEIKTIWAKILAKEIERPSSFSMRTLEVLRNISYEEAKLFAGISELVFVQDQMSFIFHNGNKYGLNYYNLSKLREAGLMQSGEQVTRTFTASKANSKYTHIFVCGNKYIELTTEHDTNDIVVPVCLLTQAGCELYELTEYRDNMGYLKDFAAFVRKENPSASVKYGDVLERKGHQIKYKLPLIEI